MTLLPPPGPQLAVGRLRVDAARAIAKLREYQLADRSAWVLEAIRAAVAAGATAIELSGEADDVWLGWEGEPWSADDLPRLFDELVSPEAEAERHHVRLLAAGVNSALGMRPKYVDVIAVDESGATRARYTPDVLDDPTDELGESALRRIIAEPIAKPDGARRGMLIHLRRRASLDVVARFLQHDEPPELTLARGACRDISVPLRIMGAVLSRADVRDVLRVPLDEGLDGFVAVIDPDLRSEWPPALEIAERGVALATYPLEFLTARADVPLRVFVDAPRMPTNASRSQVRRDSHPIAAAERRAVALLPRVLAELVAACAGTTPESARARAAAIGLLASITAGADWQWAEVPAPFDVLASAPLLRDATGVARSHKHPWTGLVYTGRKPLDPELGPWLEGLLWLPPGDPGEGMLGGSSINAGATRRYIRAARRQRKAHARFFEHAPREPRVVVQIEPRIRIRLGAGVADSGVDAMVFAGLSGEVCVHSAEGGGTIGEIVILLRGREIERVRVSSPVEFQAVIDATDLAAGDRYRSVQRDAAYARVEEAARAGALRAIEVLAYCASTLAATPPEGCTLGAPVARELDARLVRNGLALAKLLRVTPRPPLATMPVWQTTGDASVGLAELAAQQAIGVTTLTAKPITLVGRIVVRVDDVDRQRLAQLIDVPQIRYRDEHQNLLDARRLAGLVADGGGFALVIREIEGQTAVIATSPRQSISLHHRGVRLEERLYVPRILSCALTIDSDAIVPADHWAGIRYDAGLFTHDFTVWERLLVRALARALAGDRPAELLGPSSTELDSTLGRIVCTTLGALEPIELLGPELVAQLRAAPIVRLLGDPEPHSLDEVVTRFPGSCRTWHPPRRRFPASLRSLPTA